jgi:hypothetical protein
MRFLTALQPRIGAEGAARKGRQKDRRRPSRPALRVRPQLEALEDRIVLSASLLKDIGVALGNPNPQDLTAVGSTLYFSAQDPGNPGLGMLNGNNFALINIAGSDNYFPTDLTAVGNNLYFSAGLLLWKYDGSNLSNIQVGTYGTPNPSDLTAVGNTLYFDANDGRVHSQNVVMLPYP